MKFIYRFFIVILLGSLIIVQACQPDEPTCDDIICLNGGTCFDGTCDCPEGYIGETCEEEDLPISLSIGAVKVVSFPEQNELNESWDNTSNPDLYIKISLNGTIIYKNNDPIMNADLSASHLFTLDNISLYGVKNEFKIELFDFDDFSSDDLMGYETFIPYTKGTGFPSKIDLGTGNLKFELSSLQYNFEQ